MDVLSNLCQEFIGDCDFVSPPKKVTPKITKRKATKALPDVSDKDETITGEARSNNKQKN